MGRSCAHQEGEASFLGATGHVGAVPPADLLLLGWGPSAPLGASGREAAVLEERAGLGVWRFGPLQAQLGRAGP